MWISFISGSVTETSWFNMQLFVPKQSHNTSLSLQCSQTIPQCITLPTSLSKSNTVPLVISLSLQPQVTCWTCTTCLLWSDPVSWFWPGAAGSLTLTCVWQVSVCVCVSPAVTALGASLGVVLVLAVGSVILAYHFKYLRFSRSSGTVWPHVMCVWSELGSGLWLVSVLSAGREDKFWVFSPFPSDVRLNHFDSGSEKKSRMWWGRIRTPCWSLSISPDVFNNVMMLNVTLKPQTHTGTEQMCYKLILHLFICV